MANLIEPTDPNIGRTIGGFHVERMLSAGGMGTVYLARQELTNRPTALKLIHPHLVNREMLGRFQQEAVAVSRLIHPNIVTVFSYGQDDRGSLFIAMEYLDGQTLADALAEEGPFEPSRALPMMIQLSEALACAHDENVIHRDIKPENIMLTRFGRKEGVKVLDFGIAKILDDETVRTKTGAFVGSPPFMSPEQWRQDRTIDGRTDIYSLGCVFYLMLVGELPFKGTTTLTFMKAHLTDRPSEPAEIMPEIGDFPGLDRIVMACLARERDDRHPDAYHLAEELSQVALAIQARAVTRRRTSGVPLESARSGGTKPFEAPGPPQRGTTNTPVSVDTPTEAATLLGRPAVAELPAALETPEPESSGKLGARNTPTPDHGPPTGEAETLSASPGALPSGDEALDGTTPTISGTPEHHRLIAEEREASGELDFGGLRGNRFWVVAAALLATAVVVLIVWHPWRTSSKRPNEPKPVVKGSSTPDPRRLQPMPPNGVRPNAGDPRPTVEGGPTSSIDDPSPGTLGPNAPGPGPRRTTKPPTVVGNRTPHTVSPNDEKGSPGATVKPTAPVPLTATPKPPKTTEKRPTTSEKTPKPKTTTAEIRQPKTPPPSAKVVSIIVISKPSGARLYVDGTDNGETPALLSLSSGKPRATLMLKLEGYHEINRVVNLELARMLKKKRLVVTLKRRASRKKTKKPPKIW